jgi:hypothetical protein
MSEIPLEGNKMMWCKGKVKKGKKYSIQKCSYNSFPPELLRGKSFHTHVRKKNTLKMPLS